MTNTKNQRLYDVLKKFKYYTDLSVYIGVELEFYLLCNPKVNIKQFIQEIYNINSQNQISCYTIEKEEGYNQYEAKFQHSSNIKKLTNDINNFKKNIINYAKKSNSNVIFEAKPYINQPGSSMHVHISLYDKNGDNAFLKLDHQQENNITLYSIGGLCDLMLKNMIYFAPFQQSYQRFIYPDYQTPTKICWGVNNRTAAIRIPTSTNSQNHRRLEHRVPGADSNPIDVFTSIIQSILIGLQHKILPPPRLYGLASDPQYQLINLPTSICEALQHAFTL